MRNEVGRWEGVRGRRRNKENKAITKEYTRRGGKQKMEVET